METVDNRTFKEKLDDKILRMRFKAEDAKRKIANTVKEHPGETLTVVLTLAPVALTLGNSLVRKSITRSEDKRRKCDVWDPKKGLHYYTKRPMTANQQLEYTRRYQNGENGAEILRSMKLI